MHQNKINTEIIWNNCSNNIKSFIRHQISDSSLADDILQEVFIKIHEKIGTLKDDAKISPWIYTIARNTIIDYFRKNKLKPENDKR